MRCKLLIIITIAVIWTTPVLCGYGSAAPYPPGTNPMYQAKSRANYPLRYNSENSDSSGNLQLITPNVINESALKSLLMPSKCGKYQIIATKPLPPMIVNQPDSPPIYVNSGYAPEIKAPAVIYKMKPSVIYQHEVINKAGPPLTLNPVYVKVVEAPAPNPPSAPSSQSYGNPANYNAPAPKAYEYTGPMNESPSYTAPQPQSSYGGSGADYPPSQY